MDALSPFLAGIHYSFEMARMGAVDQEILGPILRPAIDGLDRLAQGFAFQQTTVDLDSERDRYGNALCSLGGANNADSFFGSVQRERRHHIGARLRKGSNLRCMIGFRLRSVHVAGLVAVTARTDHTIDNDGRVRPLPAASQLVQIRN